MSIGGISGAQALQSFLAEKALPNNTSDNRLYIKGNKLTYDADIGCMTLFAAKLGFGSAAMSNVSKFIKKNKATCLTDDQAYTDYNTFISAYNDKQCLGWKKAKKVKNVAAQVFQGGSDQAFDYGSRDGMLQLVKHNLENCKTLLNSSDLEDDFAALADACQMLNFTLQTWELDGKITSEEKQTINEILNFKNAIRNTIFPPKGKKPLKGADCVYNPLKNISQADKDALKTNLSEIRTQVLQKYFRERLEADGNRLAQLRLRFEENKATLKEAKFLGEQLDRWENKHAHGKPIAIPKWYHCTKTPQIIDAIIGTDVLYKHDGMYPGVFAANLPEHGYGTHCLMMSDHIEKTGIKEGNQKLYPKFSNMTQPQAIKYSDTPVAPENANFNNNQDGLGIWFGFQRGLNSAGQAGIPIQKMERIKDGALKYYRDTTLGFIYSANNPYAFMDNGNDTAAMKNIGEKYRIPVITHAEADALRTLINATFFCTLPASWDGQLNHC